MNANTSESMSIGNTVANLIVDKLQPDYSTLRAEIESHQFVSMKFHVRWCASWHKILFTTDYHAIVQEVLLTSGHTRFRTYKLELSDWSNKFRGWIDEEHERYYDVLDSWNRGMGQYGANV